MSFIGDAVDSIFGGGGGSAGQPTQITTSNQDIPDWLKTYYTGGDGKTGILEQAGDLYSQGAREYFPGQTVQDYDPATMQGLEGIQNQAENDTLTSTAYDQMENIASGGMMGGNPYIDQVVDQVGKDATSAVNSNAFFGGREGSGAHANAVAETVGDLSNRIRMQDYASERQMMQRGIESAPSMAAARYAPYQQMMGVGGAYEAKEGERMADERARYDFAENEPYDRLAKYQSFVGNAPLMTNQSTSTYAPTPGFSGAGMLGGGMTGAMAGNMLGATTGAMAWPYALGGAVLGSGLFK